MRAQRDHLVILEKYINAFIMYYYYCLSGHTYFYCNFYSCAFVNGNLFMRLMSQVMFTIDY